MTELVDVPPKKVRKTQPPQEKHTYPLTDTGNAELLCDRYGARIRYDHMRGRWLTWQGHYWGADRKGHLYQWAIESSRYRFETAPDETASKFARASENANRIKSALEIARNLPPIADPGIGWDSDPWRIACENGVVNLHTGALEQGHPSQRLTQTVGYQWDPKAECPTWVRFISELFPNQPAIIAWMQRVLGYCLTGSVREQLIWVLWGKGSNGKSTFLETISEVLGEYGGTIAFRTIQANKESNIPSDIASLVGKRHVWASETAENAALNEARVKAISGGDRLTARFLRENEFTFSPQAKLMIGVNHLPRITDDSTGMWRRVRLVPFLAHFDAATRDLAMKEKLVVEKQGVLRWMVHGAIEYLKYGLETPPSVAVATAEYKQVQDVLGEWQLACVMIGEKFSARAADLYGSYTKWCQEQGYREREILSASAFGRRLAERYTKERLSTGIWYVGLGLKMYGMKGLPISAEDSEDQDLERIGEGGQTLHTLHDDDECGCGKCPTDPGTSDVDCAGKEYVTSHCSICCGRQA